MTLKTRDLFVCQRTQLVNALRGHLAEHGIVAPQGIVRLKRLCATLNDETVILTDALKVYPNRILSHISGPTRENWSSRKRDCNNIAQRWYGSSFNADPRLWPNIGRCDFSLCAWLKQLSTRSRFFRMDGSYTKTAFFWRWKSHGPHLENVPTWFEAIADHRGNGCCQVGI